MTEDNIPPSEDVRHHEIAAEVKRVTRRRIAGFYGSWFGWAAVAIASVWWNAYGPGWQWWAPAMATLWIVWSALLSTIGANRTFQESWLLASTFTIVCMISGRPVPDGAPHVATSRDIARRMGSVDKALAAFRRHGNRNPET